MKVAKKSWLLIRLFLLFVWGAAAGCGADGSTNPPEPPCTPLAPLPRRIWRLSVAQYGNAVRDLLGLPTAPSLDTTGGTSPYALFTGETANVDPQLLFQINAVVREVIGGVAARIPELAACQTGEAKDACAHRFAERFGRRAFRRPLEESEITGLLAVYTEGNKKDFDKGISLMIQALLQSPSFLFRSELGTGTADTSLTSYEVATQLAYTFLDSTPDDALLEAAASGRLDTSDGIAREIDRLLTTDAAKQNITRIVLGWFNTRQLYSKTKPVALLTALGGSLQDQGALQNDLYESARRFVDDVLWSPGGKVTDLVTSERLFVNQRLATLYDLPFAGGRSEEFVAVEVASGERAGMLTQPATLWAASDPAVTSIVKRGLFVHNDVVCADPLPPPVGILEDPAVQATLAMLPTEIDKSNYRLKTETCARCHANIDPYGLILENFDSIGRFRMTADGKSVEATGDFTNAPPLHGRITGPVAFGRAIVDDGQLTQCAVQKIASYARGRMIRDSATCEVHAVRSAFAHGDGSIRELFRSVMVADVMRKRTGMR